MGTKKMNENQTVLPEVIAETETGKELLLRKQEEEKLSKQLDTKTGFIRKEVSNPVFMEIYFGYIACLSDF